MSAISRTALAPALAECRATIAHHSKSFALAARLLPEAARADAEIVYTWCRRADDAVDLAASGARAGEALARLRGELDRVYAGEVAAGEDVVVAAVAGVVRRHAIPRRYAEDLLAGMQMDVEGWRYEGIDDLLLYCYRVAGTVGLMMSHVMGVSDPGALRHAAHLGIAMQLTNIARDVAEDWERGRLYLPEDLLRHAGIGDLHGALGGPLPVAARGGLVVATCALLDLADRYYRSGDRGLPALHWRCALAIRTARLVYAAIATALARQGWDPFLGRAVVSRPRKLLLAGFALLRAVAEVPRRLRRRFTPVALGPTVPHDLVRL